MNKYYEYRKENRLCYRCGAALPEGYPHTMCQDCKDKIHDYLYKRYHKRREQGICWRCGEPARPGMASCLKCAMARNEYYNKYNQTRKGK